MEENKADGFLTPFYRIETTTWQNSPSLVNAMKAAGEQHSANFLFPGHNKGQAAPSSLVQLIGERPFIYDLPELDNLFDPLGPILQAQKEAAQVFGASKTWFLVGGTTCGVHAAIMASCSPGDTLILPRNSHVSAISAMVFSGLVPKYIFPDYDFDWHIPTIVSPSQVEKAIVEVESKGIKPCAVFITSPTYHGICCKLLEISTICHQRNIPLIVDEAHGAHFSFHPSLPSSALQQGADVVIQSTHKVLSSLTQSSMLHLQGQFINEDKIHRCLQCLQTTSPSSLLLASLDATTTQLKENPTYIFENAINLALEAKSRIKQIPGLSVLDFPYKIDPLRFTIQASDLGISGYEIDEFLYKDQKVISELPEIQCITFPFPPGTCREHVDRLILGLKNLSSLFFPSERKKEMKYVGLRSWNCSIKIHLTPREAFFYEKRKVDIKDAIGKVCGELICLHPPSIPLVIPGETISKHVIDTLLQSRVYGAKVTGASDPLLSSILICDM
ncbi:unnamed protein product [Amaranthus hypochondriacus]